MDQLTDTSNAICPPFFEGGHKYHGTQKFSFINLARFLTLIFNRIFQGISTYLIQK
jgi:hypothetical protein